MEMRNKSKQPATNLLSTHCFLLVTRIGLELWFEVCWKRNEIFFELFLLSKDFFEKHIRRVLNVVLGDRYLKLDNNI